ncbi:hypothetical protein RhiirC2_799940 [Rhizophagus irregularis]|uniref:MULE transposase domain-containing protein n=1 Tax=Rhizophagus irregularis TaxID=588596 RepID=A0A2N1M490_9GLOM|nr:hypothetical protein RhiirC2_799940 [Rhizophagus irregularis]
MISEVIPPVELSNHDNHDNNEDNKSTTPFAENIYSSNFKDCIGNLPLINTLIKLEVGTSFYSMTIAVHYIEQFALQNNFAVFKHKSEKFLDGTCRKKLLDLQANNPAWFVKPLLDDTSNHLISIFWMQRERWIKFYNIIIHNNTAKTNKYNYPLSLFILINNYNKTCEISPLTFVTDGDPAMIAAISTVFPEAHHMQCLFQLYQNLPKNLRSCLSSSLYQEFLKDFRAVQRSHCEKVFEQRSQNLEAIENRFEFESINTRYSIWKTSTLQYTQPLIIQTFFSGIDSIMKKYLTQPIHDAHYKQMCQSVCYFMRQVSMDLQLLMAMVNIDDIIEIWKISRYNYLKTYQFVILLSTAHFHLTLIPCHWYKDEYISSSEVYYK